MYYDFMVHVSTSMFLLLLTVVTKECCLLISGSYVSSRSCVSDAEPRLLNIRMQMFLILFAYILQ